MKKALKYDWLVYGCVGVSFFAPLFVNTIFLVIAMFYAVSVMDWTVYTERVQNNKFGLACIVFFTWNALSLFWSTNLTAGLSDVSSKLSLLIIPLLIFPALNISDKRQYKVWWLFIGGALFISLLALAMAGVDVYLRPEVFSSPTDSFTYEFLGQRVHFQPIYLSLYIIVAFFLCLFHASETGKFKWFHNVIMGFFLFMLIMLSSRMEIMIFFAVLTAILMVWGKRTGKLTKMIGVSAGLFAVIVILILSSATNRLRFKEMFDTKQSYSENQFGGRALRVQKWKYTIDCWKKEPIVGTGAGDYKEILQQTYVDNDFELGYKNHFNSHNQYLQTLMATGVIGLFTLLLLFGSTLVSAFRSKNWVSLTFTVVFVLSCITESMMERQRGIVFFVFFASFLLSRKSTR